MTKTDHVDFEEQELRQAIERDVAAAGLWDTCAECGLAPEKELAFINERLVEGGYEPFAVDVVTNCEVDPPPVVDLPPHMRGTITPISSKNSAR